MLREVGANDLKVMTFYRVLAGGDANPVVTLPATWVGTAAGMSGQIAVWRGVNATPFDTVDTTNTAAAATLFVAPAITTVTAGAMVVSVVATGDDNDLDLGTAAGFIEQMSGTAYDTTTGGDHAVGLADEVQVAPGAVGMPQWRQNNSTSDPWVAITFALRPQPPPPAERISFSFDETSWTGAAGEVIDDSTYGLDGVAVGGATTANTTPALAANPGTCRYGVFDGTNGYVQVADNAALDIIERADRGRLDLHALDAARAAHDRVERHELRVSHRHPTAPLLVVERQRRHRALDHDDDADRAESVVSRRRHLSIGRAAHLHQRRRAGHDGQLHRHARDEHSCRCSSARTGTSRRASSTATSTRCASSPTR